MNRLTLILPALLLIILVGCRVGQSAAIDIDVSKSPTPSGEASESPIPSSEIKYISETSVEDCYLCNGDIENIEPTVTVDAVIKPIYNFKAGEDG